MVDNMEFLIQYYVDYMELLVPYSINYVELLIPYSIDYMELKFKSVDKREGWFWNQSFPFIPEWGHELGCTVKGTG